jgi:hypothetical protein
MNLRAGHFKGTQNGCLSLLHHHAAATPGIQNGCTMQETMYLTMVGNNYYDHSCMQSGIFC